MTETLIDLGDQRLILGQNLGDAFVRSIESLSSPNDSPAIKAVRIRLFNNPSTKLLGYEVKEGEGPKEIEASLCRQMGLPPSSRLRDVKDRLVGRENKFLLVVRGLSNLPPADQKRIKKRLNKGLQLESIYE